MHLTPTPPHLIHSHSPATMQRTWSEETIPTPDSTSWLEDNHWQEASEDDGPADSTTTTTTTDDNVDDIDDILDGWVQELDHIMFDDAAFHEVLENVEALNEISRRRQLPELAADRLPDQSHWSLLIADQGDPEQESDRDN